MDVYRTLAGVVEKDPAAGSFLIDAAMYDMAQRDLRSIPARAWVSLADDMRREVAVAKAALVRTYVSKASEGTYPSADHVRTATWLAGIDAWLGDAARCVGTGIDKSDSWETWNAQDGQRRVRVKRDARGRFSSVGGKTDVVGSKDRHVGQRIGPVMARTKVEGGVVRRNPDVSEDEDEKIALFQGAYEDARSQGKAMLAAVPRKKQDEALVDLKLADGSTLEGIPLKQLASDDKKDQVDFGDNFSSLDQRITGIRLQPMDDVSEQAANRMAQFNRMNILGQFANIMENPEAQQFLHSRGFGESRSQAAMGRIGLAGRAIGAIAPNSKLGEVARFIGAYGPEAANVMAPHVKRVAYRYRGVERSPSPTIRAALEGDMKATVDDLAAAIDSGRITAGEAAARIGPPKQAGKDTKFNEPLLQSIRWRGKENPQATGDQIRLGARSDAAAAELVRTLPRESLVADIARHSGRGLPSQGIIIDEDGDIRTQAVGYTNDHYLPFNLQNMDALRGGQYIRTRVGGGLTGEDIAATIFGGARSSTVVSSSGVFRLEMDPTFRGARAMSDVAASMYDSYLRNLNAIRDQEIYHKKPDKAAEETAHLEAAKISRDPTSPEYQRKFQQVRAEQMKRMTEVTPSERKELRDKAAADFPDDPKAQDEAFEQALYEAETEKFSRVILNGRGYLAAMQTLAAQYPYYIRKVEWQPLQGNPKVDRDMGSSEWKRQGFLARMGMSPGAARSTTGADPNAIRPGQEPWRVGVTPTSTAPASTTPQTETPVEPQEGRQAPGGGQAPTSPQQGPQAPQGGPQAPGGGGSPQQPPQNSTESPAARRAMQRMRMRDDQKAKAVDGLVSELQPFMGNVIQASNAGDLGAGVPMAQNRWGVQGNTEAEQIADANSYVEQLSTQNRGEAKLIEHMLGAPSPAMFEAVATGPHREQVIRALGASPDTWRQALKAAFSRDGLADVIASSKPFGATNEDELVDAVRTRASHVVDVLSAGTPFQKLEGDDSRRRSQMLSTSSQALDFPDLLDVADETHFNTRVAGDKDFKELMPLASRLGVSADGLPRSFSDTSRVMSSITDVLTKMDDQFKQARSQGNQDVAALAGDVVSNLRSDRDKWEVFSAVTGVDDAGVTAMLTGGNSDEAVLDLAMKVQKARALVEVARSFDMMKEGGELPKAWRGLLPQWADREPATRVLHRDLQARALNVSKALDASRAHRRAGRVRKAHPVPDRIPGWMLELLSNE